MLLVSLVVAGDFFGYRCQALPFRLTLLRWLALLIQGVICRNFLLIFYGGILRRPGGRFELYGCDCGGCLQQSLKQRIDVPDGVHCGEFGRQLDAVLNLLDFLF